MRFDDYENEKESGVSTETSNSLEPSLSYDDRRSEEDKKACS